MTPRGIRCFNPGNIREYPVDKTAWVGERATDDDPIFEEFQTMEYGVRALARVLINYKKKHGVDTIRKAITRWAPAVENDTDKYVDHVADQVGFGPDDRIDLENRLLLCRLVNAIIRHENGLNNGEPWVSTETIRAGVNMA
jgi:hypothetical protein